jgi:anti-anti-sigma factor
MTETSRARTGHRRNANRRSRHVPADTTTWESARGEPSATVTITWAVDAHDTTIVDLTGDLCTVTVQRIRALLADVAERSPGNVAIDASAVTFIDSRGLSLLLVTQNRLAERGLRCRVVSPSRTVRRLFELVHLDDRLCTRASHGRSPSP